MSWLIDLDADGPFVMAITEGELHAGPAILGFAFVAHV
jgi:hypothetical protein